jgi:hypothetical protein
VAPLLLAVQALRLAEQALPLVEQALYLEEQPPHGPPVDASVRLQVATLHSPYCALEEVVEHVQDQL